MARHPGEFLAERILVPNGISIRRAADQLGVSAPTLAEVIAGQSPMTLELAHGLAREFGHSCQFWLALQHAWEVERRLAA